MGKGKVAAVSIIGMLILVCDTVLASIFAVTYMHMGLGIFPPCISAPLRQTPSDLVYKHQNTGIVYKPIRNHFVPKHQMLRICIM